MAIQPKTGLLSVEDYLAGELVSETRHEYIDGRVYAMTSVSVRHNQIAANLLVALHAQLRGTPCQVFIADVKLRLSLFGRDVFYYSDLMVCCDPEDNAEYYRTRPCLIVEILSEGTERIDRREKLLHIHRLTACRRT